MTAYVAWAWVRAWRGGRLLACTVLLAGAGQVRAQTTGTLVGTVTDAATGRPVAGALVVARSPALQGEQTAVTDGGGHYVLTLLPPGRYRVAGQVQGYLPGERGGLALRVDFTLRANLVLTPEAVRVDEQVVRTRGAPAVNVGNAEAGAVLSREFLATVPTTRDYEGAVMVVPTAIRDPGGFSLGGATSPENNYILDGFRVGDPSFNYLGANLLTNFIDQVDVKTGGFLPEYGYSSGGIVNTLTRSGSNEFHGSIWGNLTPGIFTPPGPETGSNGQAIASYSSPYKGSYQSDFGLEVGGPILKDRLWFYAGVASRMNYNVRTAFYRTRVASAENPARAAIDPYGMFVMQQLPGTEVLLGSGTDTIQAVGKLTWLLGENHNLNLSMNTQPAWSSGRGGLSATPSVNTSADYGNTTNVVLGYGGKFLDKHLLVEANLGWYDSPFVPGLRTVGGVDQATTPLVLWNTLQPLQNFDPAAASACPYQSRQAGIGDAPGCYVQGYRTGGPGYVEESTTRRLAGTVSVTAFLELLGQHALKGGVQIDYARFDGMRRYTGGGAFTAYGRFLGPGVAGTGGSFNAFSLEAYGRLDPASALPQPGPPIRSNWCSGLVDGQCQNPGGKDPAQATTNSVYTHNWANGFYLQDSWTIANVLTLGFGVRLDTQSMTNASPDSPPETPRLDTGNGWAPRVQAIWDFTGQGRGKVQASWGRYYESVPLILAFASLSSTPTVNGAYQLSTCTSEMIPGPTSQGSPLVSCPNVYGLPAGSGPGPNTRTLGRSPLLPAGFSLYAPYFSPIAPGLEGQYTDQFGGGVQYEVLQDLTIAVDYLGRRQGAVIEDMSSTEGSSYFIANPAASQPWTATEGPYAGSTFNPRYAASFDLTTSNVYTAPFARPVRSYDAVTVSVNKLFSRRWLAMASYTWSSLRGNYSGLIRSDAGQYAPNILTEYDLVSMMGNRSGPLGSDRTHQVKAAGSYLLSLGEDVSLTPGVQLWALSGTPANAFGAHVYYGNGDGFLIPRGMAGNLSWTASLDLAARLTWALGGSYALDFTLSVFNVLNSNAATTVDQRYTFDFITPMQGAQCSAKDSMSQKDPLAAIVARCPDLAYARTIDGQRVSPNLNYGRPTGFQVPVSARFGIALSF